VVHIEVLYPLSAIFHFCLLLPVGVFGSVFPGILILALSTRFIHFYAASRRNGGVRATIKNKTLPLFCFPEHNCRGWRRAAVSVIKCYIFNVQDSFILLTNNMISCQGL